MVPAATARVRFGHCSPDLSNLDFHVDHNRIVENLAPSRVDSYVDVPAGDHEIKVTHTHETDTVVRGRLDLEENGRYTVLVTGDGRDLGATVYHNDPGPIPAGSTRLRLIHAATGVPKATLRHRDSSSQGHAKFRSATDYFLSDNPSGFEVIPEHSTEPVRLSATGFTEGLAYTAVLIRDSDADRLRTRLAVDSVSPRMTTD